MKSEDGEGTAEGKPLSLTDELLAETYDQLRAIASRRIGADRSATINTTLIVHEAWLKLSSDSKRNFKSRAHYLATASRAMRQVLVDHARSKLTGKRGGGASHVDIDAVTVAEQPLEMGVLDINTGLDRLGSHAPDLVRVVECRFFAGMTVPETAEALQRSSRTIERDWAKARIYLSEYLGADARS